MCAARAASARVACARRPARGPNLGPDAGSRAGARGRTCSPSAPPPPPPSSPSRAPPSGRSAALDDGSERSFGPPASRREKLKAAQIFGPQLRAPATSERNQFARQAANLRCYASPRRTSGNSKPAARMLIGPRKAAGLLVSVNGGPALRAGGARFEFISATSARRRFVCSSRPGRRRRRRLICRSEPARARLARPAAFRWKCRPRGPVQWRASWAPSPLPSPPPPPPGPKFNLFQKLAPVSGRSRWRAARQLGAEKGPSRGSCLGRPAGPFGARSAGGRPAGSK